MESPSPQLLGHSHQAAPTQWQWRARFVNLCSTTTTTTTTSRRGKSWPIVMEL